MDQTNITPVPSNNNIGTKPQLPGVFDLVRRAFDIYGENAATYIWLSVFLVLTSFLFGFLSAIIFVPIGLLFDKSAALGILLGALVVIAVMIVFIYITSYFSAALLCAIKEKARKIGAREAMALAKPFVWQFIILSILVGLYVFFGIILFIIPGIIFSIWFCFAVYALIWEGKNGTEAMKRSKDLANGYWWAIFGRMLAGSLLVGASNALLNLIPFVGVIISIIIVTPIFIIYGTLIYEAIKSIKGEVVALGAKK